MYVAINNSRLQYHVGFSLFRSVILVQYSDKFMHSIVLYSVVPRRSQLYCIVTLLLLYVDII